jgi:hypothetical protein
LALWKERSAGVLSQETTKRGREVRGGASRLFKLCMISVDLSQDLRGDVLDVTKQIVHSLITLRVT